MAFTPPIIPYPLSPPLRYTGHDFDGLIVSDKRIESPPVGVNYECLHIENVDDVHVNNLDCWNFPKNAIRLFGVNGARLNNIRGDANKNDIGNFCMNLLIGQDWERNHCFNVSVTNSTFMNARAFRYEGGFQNADLIVFEGNQGDVLNPDAPNMLLENILCYSAEDALIDTKSNIIIRNAVLDAGWKSGIKVWYGTTVTLINVTIKNCGAGLRIVGGKPASKVNASAPHVGKQGVVKYYNLTMTGNNVDVFLAKHSGGGSPTPTMEEGFIELPADPFPNGLPHYSPGGIIMPPVSPPPPPPPTTEPPMPTLDPTDDGYAIVGQESWVKADGTENFFPVVFDVPMDLAYGHPKDSEWYSGNFAYLANVPAGEFMFMNEAFGGDPDPGHAKTGFGKPSEVAPPPPPPPPVEEGLNPTQINEVQVLIDMKLEEAAWATTLV